MKKGIFLFLLCSTILFGEVKTNDMFGIPQIEKETFIEKNDDLKERLLFLKEREKKVLKIENQSGMDRTEELENLNEKYEKILKKFTSLKFKILDEKEQEERLLKFEEESYKDFYKRITEVERKYKTE